MIPQRVRITLLRVAAGNDKDHQVIGAATAAVVGTNVDLAILLLEMLVSKN